MGIRGYVEGVVYSASCYGQFAVGEEIVYDFVSKPPTRARFTFSGGGGANVKRPDLAISTYVGFIWGLDGDIANYAGPSMVGSVGVTIAPAIFEVGMGISYFRSTTNPALQGVAAYDSVGIGANPPGIGLGVSSIILNYDIVRGSKEEINLETLTSSISMGTRSPVGAGTSLAGLVRPVAAWVGQEIVTQIQGPLP